MKGLESLDLIHLANLIYFNFCFIKPWTLVSLAHAYLSKWVTQSRWRRAGTQASTNWKRRLQELWQIYPMCLIT